MKSVKYPRTYHLPESPGRSSDDKVLKNINHLLSHEVVITEKMDGENTTLYRDGFHARSIDSRHHSSRDWLAKFHGEIGHEIPESWRICGENCYAKHSIEYTDLKSYFFGFSVWEQRNNQAFSWDDTLEIFEGLGITPVKELYRGALSQKVINDIVNNLNPDTTEGFVIRLACHFDYADFNRYVAKWVKANHVQTDEHWMHKQVIPNKLSFQRNDEQ